MIEVLKQALEALYPISHNSTDDYRGQADKAIASLRKAIQEEALRNVQRIGQEIEQEPYGWVSQHTTKGMYEWQFNKRESSVYIDTAISIVPVYTHPPQRIWVGLTDEEIIDVIHPLVMADMTDQATDYEIAKAIEAKLKEKNNG